MSVIQYDKNLFAKSYVCSIFLFWFVGAIWAPALAQQARISYVYDDLGRLARVINENGEAATYHYDAVGNILRITRESGVPHTTTVTSVSANSAARNTTTTITINGFNLSCTSFSLNNPGVTLSNVQITVDQLVLTVTVSPTAQLGSFPLQLDCNGVVTVPFSIVDPVPTVVITSPADGEPVFEATDITLIAQASDNVHVNQVVWTVNGMEFPPVLSGPYAQPISIPFGTATLIIEARATDNIGQTGTVTKTVNVQPDPPPTVAITTPATGTTLIQGQQIDLTANALDNRRVASVVWTINGVPQAPNPIAPYRLTFTVPTNMSSLALQATATDDFGRTGTATRTLVVIPDPLTTVVGRIVDANNLPVVGAAVNAFNQFTATSQANGSFSIPGVPTVRGDITLVANATIAGAPFEGISVSVPPVAGGTTNVGLIIIRPTQKEPPYSGIAFATGNRPRSLLVIDLNGDGKNDLVTGNTDSSDLSVLMSNGDGTFQPERRFVAGDGPDRGPTSLVAGDLNGDGKIDLVASNTFVSNTVSVLLGNGDGTFQPQQRFGVGNGPSGAAIADLNGDGKLDIVTANSFSSDVSVLLGNGNGTFQPEQRFAVGDGPFTLTGPVSITIADVNGDGQPDILAGTSTNVAVLRGNGNGTFQPRQRFPAGVFVGPIVVRDINSDGNADLVIGISSFNSAIATMRGNGDGTFQAPQLLTVGISPQSLTLADLNGDGKQDILTGNFSSADVSVLLGNGDGSFQPEVRVPSMSNPAAIAVAPINGDTRLDLVVTNSSSGGPVAVFFGNGNGSFQSRRSLPVGNSPEAVFASDLNRDGKLDLIVANSSSNDLSVLYGNGDGSFQNQTRVPVGLFPSALVAADLDGDALPDIIVSNSIDGNISVILTSTGNRTNYATGTFPGEVALADLNGDGKLDVVTANSVSADVSVLLGNGDGTFQPQLRFAGIRRNRALAVADVNGDGKRDLIVAADEESGNNAAVLLGNGDGTLLPAQSYLVGTGTRGVAVADVNGDLKLDIIAANSFNDDVSVLLGNGDGTFQTQQRFMVGDGPRAVRVVDIDGDGRPDIVTSSNAGFTVSLGNGDGTFVTAQQFVTSGSVRGLVIADFDNDGKPDVATADNFRNQASVLLHR